MLARCFLSFSLWNCVKAEPKDSCSGGNHMIIYADTNIKHNNIGSWSRPIYDGEQCADECLKTNGCKAFTMSKYGSYRGCWIKSSTTGGIVKVAPQANLVSGVLCDGSTAKNAMPNGGYIYPEIEKPKPKPACAKRLVFSNFEKSDSDLNGFWSHVVIDGKVQENEGYPYYQQEGVNKKAKPFMWWMWHGDNGHWVVNMTPGQHGGDRLKTTLGKFECPEKQTKFEGPASIHTDMAIDVAPPKCPEDACPGKKCKMEKVFSIFVVPDAPEYKPVCIEPNEGEWSEWSEETCSASCGPGTKKRSRTCEGKRKRRSVYQSPVSRVRRFFIPGIHLPPGPVNPVKPTCEGKSEDIVACNLKKCPAWSEWGEYSECSTTCGPGSKKRLRTCDNGPCDGDSGETAECNKKACSDSTDTGEWSDWSEYSTCSVTCGPGTRKRSRTCEGKRKRRSVYQSPVSRVRRFFIPGIHLPPRPMNPVKPTCSGKSEESVACNLKECDATPYWGEWGSFGPCSTKCGPGHKIRKRKCQNGTYDIKIHKFVGCAGKAEEKALCNIKTCEGPAWTAWTEWSECSKSCANRRGRGYDRAQHRRSRTCKEGEKEVDESKCGGVHYDYKDCKNTVCQDDPIYVCDKSGFNKREGGTYAIWTNKEFKEHEIINRERRPWWFKMNLGTFRAGTVEACASACARRGWAPDGCQMFNFRAHSTWSNRNVPLFKREGKCTLFKDISKFVQLTPKYGTSGYGEQFQIGIRCEALGKITSKYPRVELYSKKSSAFTPGGTKFDPCDPKDKFYPNGGCSDICKRSKLNQNVAECSCPKGKTLVGKKNCAVGEPVKVENKVKLGTPFSEKLNDPESQEFKDLANDVIKMTKPALEETAKKNNAQVSVEVKSFFAALGFGRRRRDEDVPAAVADVEAKFFSSEKELTVDQESLKRDAESGLKEMEEIILSETDPNAEPPQYPETKELEVPPEIDFVADTAKHCPSSDCWIYEENEEGERACRLKTDAPASCPLYLGCKPATMDFRFNFEKLFGENDVLVNDEKTCEIENSDGLVGGEGGVDPTGADKMWKHAPASCDSEVSRETKDDLDYIVVKKSFIYKGDNTAQTLGASSIYLDDAATVTVEVCCRFLASHTAKSDDIGIKAGAAVEGKLEAEGSWQDSLKIEFTTEDFSAKLASDHVTILGETLRVKISWTVGDALNNPIAQKLNWYVSDCTLSDVTDAAKSVQIIQNQCFAGVVETTKVSSKMQSTENFKFSFLSFAFNKDGSGTQKIACDINFCLTATECSSKTDIVDLSCNGGAHEWRKP